MKSSLSLIASTCAVYEASSFAIQPNYCTQSFRWHRQPAAARLAPVVGAQNIPFFNSATIGRSNSCDNQSHCTRRTPTINEQFELETIRKELIQKYLSLGHSLKDAMREVEYFLEDEETSPEYVEMRMVAMARGNDLGIEIIVLGGAFLVGWAASWLFDAYHANQGLPWIS